MTIDLIIKSKQKDDEATLLLIKKFNPLLKKYAFKLFYEDAYEDLLTDFLELIDKIKIDSLLNRNEGCIVSYIATSIRNCYIKRINERKKQLNCISYSELNEKEVYYLDVLYSTIDTYDTCYISNLRNLLSNAEMSVIEKIYIYGYSTAEIAKVSGISRQAVNQMKNRALKKLSSIYLDKPYNREAG